MHKTSCMSATRFFLFALKRKGKVNPMESSNEFLGTERIGKLMQKYAIPCIISLLVAHWMRCSGRNSTPRSPWRWWAS